MTNDLATNPDAITAPVVSTIGSEGIHEFIRYFAASVIALCIDFGLLWFLTAWFDIPYLLSGALSFTTGMVVIYFLSVYWVFGERTLRNQHVEFLIFAAIGLVGLALNHIILYLFTSVFGLFFLLSKIFSVIVVFSWNFAARKWLLFRERA